MPISRKTSHMIKIRENFHKIAGLAVSWVGQCPWTSALCFGGEDGRLIFPLSQGSDGRSELLSIRPATDTINAVAFAGEHIAVSSRNEVLVGERASPDSPRPEFHSHSFIGGAHG